ncbi:hypothetical protein [uncultured Chryseobacterium sp.]|uniref:hypothetical protein n=1 Tax=uncultured Chryseobacterium sp. TaxID=259322 RepID=UPI0025DF258D|nr:hypothetical protein [uncultured Chryseobacterium sp.]
MKNNLTILVMALMSAAGFSQEYKAKIGQTACECFKKVKAESPDPELLETKMGFCIINAAEPYAKQLKKEYDLDILGDQSSETGKLIATLMLKECPDLFMEMVNSEKKGSIGKASLGTSVSGTVTRIEKGNFIIFHVIGEDGNLIKLYWVTAIDSGLDLPREYQSLLNKKINAVYEKNEIFDPGINDYRNINIISTLKKD